MSCRLILTILLVTIGCTEKRTPKDHLNKVTLKLEKSVDIKLSKLGKNGTDFNIIANIQSQSPIQTAEIQWIVINPENQKVIQRTESFKGPSSTLDFDSGNLSLVNSESNHKIVFILNAKTDTEEIHKTEIYNSLIQEELDQAIQKLEERGRY
jgi:hypothetical protein